MSTPYVWLGRRFLNLLAVQHLYDMSYSGEAKSTPCVHVYHAHQAPGLPNPEIFHGDDAALILDAAAELAGDDERLSRQRRAA